MLATRIEVVAVVGACPLISENFDCEFYNVQMSFPIFQDECIASVCLLAWCMMKLSFSPFSLCRLLIIFCVINMLNYVDRGVIASNGVNGSIETCSESGVCTPGSGIQ